MDYPVYPVYKPSGVLWLGEVPEHWDVLSIKRLTPVSRGASPRPIEDPKYFDDEGEYAWVRIADVTSNNHYLRETTQRLSELGKSLSIPLAPGALFLSIAGSVGKPMITAIPACIHDGFVYFPHLQINPEFLYYIFESGQPYLGLGKLGTQLNLNTDTVGDIKIGLPSETEQNSIVEYLQFKTAQIDALIAKKKELVEKLKEERIAAITRTVTKGLNPDAPMRDSNVSWLGQVPKHWDVRKLKFSVLMKGGGTPNTNTREYWDGDIPWVSPKDVKGNYISTTQDYITELGLVESASTLIDSNTVLIVVRSGILRHTIPVAINSVPVAINQDMKALIVSEDLLDPGYLMALIWGNQRALLALWSKQGCTVESIETEYMMNSMLPLPPMDEQKEIVAEVNKIMARIDAMQSKIELAIDRLTEYRIAIITAATTGKIDVRGVKFEGAKYP
jgi:type I restriction enzyme, S subunit